MRKIIIFLTYLFTVINCFGHKENLRGNEYQLEGKLIREIMQVPYCGRFAVAVVAEFEVITFTDKAYLRDTIAVIICCPEFFKTSFFEVEKKYKLHLADENQADFGWLIPNESLASTYCADKRYWVIDIIKTD